MYSILGPGKVNNPKTSLGKVRGGKTAPKNLLFLAKESKQGQQAEEKKKET